MSLKTLSVHVLSEYVRGICSPENLRQGDILRTDLVLDPKVANVEMPYLAQTTAPTYPDGCSGVCQHIELERQAKVPGNRLETQSF